MTKYKCNECDDRSCTLETSYGLEINRSCPVIMDHEAADWQIIKQPPNQEVANVCAKCGSHLKWWVTCWRCRNLDCRAEYPHNAEL